MTVTTDPTDAVVSISWQEVSGNTVTTEQGSGVLIAPDEVLTAAHLVYDPAGHLVTGIVVSSAAGGSAPHAVGVESSVQAMPLADWTQVASAAGDFALIHLAAPVAGLPSLPTMALSADFAGGAVTVTGFPRASAGAEASVAETLAPFAGGILQGTPLGAPGDPRGSSGGPAWQSLGGVPTVVGLTSSASGSTGFFVGLTAADVAQIGAWAAADHAPSTAPQPTAASTPVPAAAPSATPNAAAQAVAALSAGAAALPAVASHPAIDAALSRVVGLLTRDAAALGSTLGSGADFDDVAAQALSALGDNSEHRNLAAALLEGVVWGYDGGGVGGALAGVTQDDPGVAAYAAAGRAVRVGAVLGDRLMSSGF